MKINELENALGISKANIRYYESKGLINPKRKENGYRDYSEADYYLLRKIIVYRKLGIAISDIKAVLNKEKDLSDIVLVSIDNMKSSINGLNVAIELCEEIIEMDASDDNFDTDYFWNEINNRESNGDEFIEFEKIDVSLKASIKNEFKMVLKLLLSIFISFICIFLFVFFGGHMLFESGDEILIELGASVVIGVVVLLAFELFKSNRKKIEELEKRIEKLENL